MSERPTYYAEKRGDGSIKTHHIFRYKSRFPHVPVQIADLSKGERVISAEEAKIAADFIVGVKKMFGGLLVPEVETLFARLTEGRE